MAWHRALLVLSFLVGLGLAACSAIPFAPSTPPPPNTLVYDAPTSLTVKNGTVLPGTPIGYGGKTQTGAAKVLISGQVAAKQIGDSMDWQGTPVPNTNLTLNMRVVSFDNQAVNFVGTAHLELTKVSAQAVGTQAPTRLEFNAPVTYSLNKGDMIPGSKISYLGLSNDGAQFGGIEGYSYRKTLDSLQYTGRLNPKVTLKLDLRILNYSETSAVLGGAANIRIE